MSQLFEQHRYWLQTSADGLIWAAGQIPRGRSNVIPLPALGEWPASRIMFQAMWEEREITLPLLRSWHDDADLMDVPGESQVDAAWTARQPEMPELAVGFQQTRHEVITLLAAVGEEEQWSLVRPTPWGEVTLVWLVGRVYQQTLAYTVRLMDMVLYWDLLLEAQKQARLAQAESDNNND